MITVLKDGELFSCNQCGLQFKHQGPAPKCPDCEEKNQVELYIEAFMRALKTLCGTASPTKEQVSQALADLHNMIDDNEAIFAIHGELVRWQRSDTAVKAAQAILCPPPTTEKANK